MLEIPEGPDERLPPRLFATDRYPDARINVYSKPAVLVVVKGVLEGTPEFNTVRDSYFGKLFDIPVSRCSISCKLLHALMCRQLLTNKKYEMWMVFGGQPLRFSLVEFARISGLNCAEFPKKYKFKSKVVLQTGPGTFWSKLIGSDKDTTLGDIQYMLQHSENMPPWRRLALSLLLIVDGVLVSTQQYKKPTHKYVQMLEDIDSFLKFPWGRESFIHTVKSLRPGKKTIEDGEDPLTSFQKKLQQHSVSLVGFPLVLQLLAFDAVPSLLSKMPSCSDTRSFLEITNVRLGKAPSLTRLDVLDAEHQDDLTVRPLMELEDVPELGWCEWDDERIDRAVTYMEKLVRDGHEFRKPEWPGGLDSLPLIIYKPTPPPMTHKKHIGLTKETKTDLKGKGKVTGNAGKDNKKKRKKSIYSSKRKQRKLDDYFCSANDECQSSNTQFMDQIGQLKDALELLEKRTTKLERRLSSRTSKMAAKSSRKMSSMRWQSSKKKRKKHGSVLRHNISPIKVEGLTPSMTTDSEMKGELKVDQAADVDDEWDSYGVTRGVLDDIRDDNVAEYGDKVHGHTSQTESGEEILCGQPEQQPNQSANNDENKGQLEVRDVTTGQFPDQKTVDGAAEQLEQYEKNDEQPNLGEGISMEVDSERGQFSGQGYVDCNEELVAEDYPHGHDLVVRRSSPSTILLCPHNQIPVDGIYRSGPPLYGDTEGRLHARLAEDAQRERLEWNDSESFVEPQSLPITADKQTGSTEDAVGVATPVYVSDSSPVTEKMRHVPSEQEEQLAAMLLSRPKEPPFNLLPIVNAEMFEFFKTTLTANSAITHVTDCGYEFDNNFFLVLAKKKDWVSTLHMEVLVTLLSSRHTSVLAAERSCIASPWLINHLQGKYRKFHAARNKNTFKWGDDVQRCLQKPGAKWLEEVDTVYVPMIWKDNHWVALVVNLNLQLVEVLDPYISLYADRTVENFMLPVTKSLPYLIRAFCKPELTERRSLDPFVWKRLNGIYVNERAGDCGPVTMKFIELHAYGNHDDGLSNITDDLVDNFRQQYAMDVYTEMVLPLYVGQHPPDGEA